MTTDDLAEPTGTQEPIACRWIYGDPGLDREGWRYCGRVQQPGKQYCAAHWRLSYKF